MNIKTFGKGERLSVCAELLGKAACLSKYSEMIILPIPTTKDGAHLLGTEVTLAELVATVGEGSFVLGYAIPREYREALEDRGAVVCDAEGDERFLSANAELTALGTVGIILTDSKKSPSELRVGIIGYGRIGRRLLRILLFLGASVRVFTRKSSTRLELCSFGVDAEMSEEGDYSGFDYIINTAPERILGAHALGDALEKGRILELASGENFPYLDGVKRLGGLPGIMYPISAGRAYADAAIRYEGGDETC